MHSRHLIEILTPKQNVEDLDAALERFVERFQTVVDDGYVVSVPDNPMGNVHFQLTEIISELELHAEPDQVLLHLNTFHKKDEFDGILDTAAELGIRYLLLVSGDGGERLPKLEPAAIGASGESVTSVDLLDYVRERHPDVFHCGVAFNQYEPQDHEMEKLRRKLDAGASFIITQPVIGRDDDVRALLQFGIPVALGAWMSKRLDLLADCIGYPLEKRGPYDPLANLLSLQEEYPRFGIYLALLSFKNQLAALPQWLTARAPAA